MAYKPIHIANSFLAKGKEDGILIDQLKLQKLVYCLHGWNLAVNNKPAVGELYEAWPYGPVLSSLYHQFKNHKKKSIDSYGLGIEPATGKMKAQKVSESDTNFYALFDKVWNRYKGLSGLQLSTLTHANGTPWHKARIAKEPYLDNEVIRQHFAKLAKK